MPVTRRKIRNAVRAFYETPWAMLPEKIAELSAVLSRREAGLLLSPEELAAFAQNAVDPLFAYTEMFGPSQVDRGDYYVHANGTAVLPLEGIMAKKMNMLVNISGGTSTDLFRGSIQSLSQDPSVRRVVLDVDSPGGAAEGMVETTEAVRSLNRIKPVTTAVNDTMASAAYWVGSAGREIIINPMGRAGSIGVYRVHRDTSGAKEKLGVKDTLIKAGALKASDQEPLTEESLADYQSKVNQIYDMFLDAVAANRKGKLSRDAARATEGRVYIGEEAVSAGLADRVGILDELIAESPGAARKTFVSAFVPADS